MKMIEKNFFLIGFMGSGKTFWGKVWAQANGLDFFDLDELIENKLQKSVAEIFEKESESYFRNEETELLKTFADKQNFLLSCGGGTACFNENMQWMNEQGTTVYLEASPQYLFERVIDEKEKRPLIKNFNLAELLFFIEQKLKEREPFYKQAKIIFSVEKIDSKSLQEFITQNT